MSGIYNLEPFRERLLGEWRCLSYDKIADKLSYEGYVTSAAALSRWYKMNGVIKERAKTTSRKEVKAKKRYINPFVSDMPLSRQSSMQKTKGTVIRKRGL